MVTDLEIVRGVFTPERIQSRRTPGLQRVHSRLQALLLCGGLCFVAQSCVTTKPPLASGPVSADVLAADARAGDVAAAARALGLGGHSGLERWVAENPSQALSVARSDIVLDVVPTTREAYARQSGLTDARFAEAESALSAQGAIDEDRIDAARFAAALGSCPRAGTSHYAFDLGLARSRALARSGRDEDAARAWDQAIPRGLATQDEDGLRKALAARPKAATLDAGAVGARLAQLAYAHGKLDAALADARAAGASMDASVRDSAGLTEGHVLLSQGRADDARARLEPLTGSLDENMRRGALAVLGVIAAQADDLARAEQLLRRSLEGDTAWSGSARASADLAVVLVRAGREGDGRAQFAAARDRFTAQHDAVGLARTCMNESAFERSLGHDDRSRALADDARRALADGGVLAIP